MKHCCIISLSTCIIHERTCRGEGEDRQSFRVGKARNFTLRLHSPQRSADQADCIYQLALHNTTLLSITRNQPTCLKPSLNSRKSVQSLSRPPSALLASLLSVHHEACAELQLIAFAVSRSSSLRPAQRKQKGHWCSPWLRCM